VVVISHDRVVPRPGSPTHVLAFEGDSEVRWWEGKLSATYEIDRKRRLGADADQPHRLRYKPLLKGGAGR